MDLEDRIEKPFGMKKLSQDKEGSAFVAGLGLVAYVVSSIIAYTHGGQIRTKTSEEEWQEKERKRYITPDGKRTIW